MEKEGNSQRVREHAVLEPGFLPFPPCEHSQFPTSMAKTMSASFGYCGDGGGGVYQVLVSLSSHSKGVSAY